MAFSMLPSVSLAADIGSLSIQSAQLSQDGNEVQVAFSVKNISDISQEVAYGIRLQGVDTQKIFEIPIDSIILNPLEETVRHAKVTLPGGVLGAYDTFLLSRDEKGMVSVLEYSGRAIFVKSIDDMDNSQGIITGCEVVESVITCSIEGSNSQTVDINYIVHKGSIYGKVVTEGALAGAKITEDTIMINIPSSLSGGDYTYRIWLEDKVFAQNIVVHIVPDDIVNEAKPVFNNSIIEDEGSVNYIRIAIILLPIILLFMLLYFALRRPRVSLVILATTSLALSGVAFAAITLTDDDVRTHVFNGLSLDSESEQFVITLNKVEYQTDEHPQLAITFQETTLPNNKPLGGIIDINIDGGSWQSLVTSSDGSIVMKTIAPIITAGTHTLNFRSPSLCGGAFSKSLFNFGIFGTTECLFSMPITVVQNDPPTTPIIGGTCLLGVPCNIGIVSTDTDGGQLCYQAQWPDGASSSAGCVTEGNPVSVPYTFNSCNSVGTTVQAQATDTSGLLSAWGIGSTSVPSSITCTIPCSHCTYSGTTGNIGLAALPPFLPPNGVVEVSWSLTNVATCSMEGRVVGSGAQVDYWDWDVLRTTNHKLSSALSDATEYVLTCTDLDGATKTESLIISTIPIWQEL